MLAHSRKAIVKAPGAESAAFCIARAKDLELLTSSFCEEFI
jgi:hypothetical protein